LPPTKIHPIHLVFHCSQLKLCKGYNVQPYVSLPITNSDIGSVLQLEAILQNRIIRNQQQVQQLEDNQAMCEDNMALKQGFPEFKP